MQTVSVGMKLIFTCTSTGTQRGTQLILVMLIASTAIANYGDMRICNDNGNCGVKSGRLEFQDKDGTWGTVCNYGFDDNSNAVQVACRQLGYHTGNLLTDQHFPPTNLSIAVCYTGCDGDEKVLYNCTLELCRVPSTRYCTTHSRDIGISCSTTDQDDDKLWIIIAGSAGGVVLLVVLVIAVTGCVCCMLVRKRRHSYSRIELERRHSSSSGGDADSLTVDGTLSQSLCHCMNCTT